MAADPTCAGRRRSAQGGTGGRKPARTSPAAGAVECRRIGTRQSDGSWQVIAIRADTSGANHSWVVGYAHPNTQPDGTADPRRLGWHVRNLDGQMLVSRADGTRLGNTLSDCLYILERTLEQQEAVQ